MAEIEQERIPAFIQTVFASIYASHRAFGEGIR